MTEPGRRDAADPMTATCHRWDTLRYCEELAAEVARFAALTRGADPTRAAPTCPGWTVARLVEHVGAVHRWATAHVRTLAAERIPGRDIVLDEPDSFDGRADWILAGLDPMLATFADADPDAEVWGWGSDRHARFWPRRMVHETAVHRADLAFAVGGDASIDPQVSIDGVDEFLDNLPYARAFAPGVDELRGDGETLLFAAPDAAVGWRVRLDPDRFAWEHGDGQAHATVAEEAARMLLLFYGRLAPATVAGDQALYQRWRQHSSI